MDKGYGLAFLDPNGDAAEDFLRLIPGHRVEDTIYFNPADRDYPPAFNVLEASDDREREMLASDLLVALKHLFERWWGYRQEILLRQCIMTLLFSKGTKNLRDITRLLLDEAYRESVLETVEDQDIHAFWRLQFPTLRREAMGPVLSKVSKFVDNRLVRAIIAQPNLIDFQRVMNEGKVFVANLSKGLLQEDTSILLGSMILAKLQVATMARAGFPPHERRPFVIVVDEFQNYAGEGADTSSIRGFLSEARKYNVGLVAATQFISQLAKEVQAAIFGNVGTLVALRCGVFDAHLLQKELGRFTMDDILDLGVGQAIVRMERAADSFNVAIDEVKVPQHSHRDDIVALSREQYCRPREEVEAMLRRPEPPRPPKAEGEAAKSVALNREARMFLAYVVEHPDRSVTQLYSDLCLSGYKGDQTKKALLKGGLVNEVAAPLGQRGRSAKFLVPTGAAYAALGRERPRGKGGPLHRLLQRLVEQKARRKGYEAVVEAPVPGGQVDVALRGHHGNVAVEIEVSPNEEQRLVNIRKCLDNGFDRVLILFADRQEWETSKPRIEASLAEEERARVSFCLLDELDQHL